jgi:hypothetical protein
MWSALRSNHCCGRGVSTGIGVDSWGWISGRDEMFLHNAQTDSGAHQASYTVSTRWLFHGGWKPMQVIFI